MLETQPVVVTQEGNAPPTARVPLPANRTLSQKSIFLVLLVAALLNAGIVLVALPKLSRPLMLTYSLNFGDLYDLIGRNLEEGSGYRVDAKMGPTMLREPGYPILLAAAFKVAGYDIQTARVVCVLLAFGAALLLLRLTLKITGDAMIAFWAALVFLLYPSTIFAEARAGIELPFIFTVLLFMLVLYSAVEKGSLWRYWAAGLLLGVVAMVRGQILLFPVFLFVYLMFASKRMSDRVKITLRLAILCFGMLIIMSPWIVRNYILVHKLVPTGSVAGIAAQEGLYACEDTTSEPFYLAQTRAGFARAQLASQLGLPFTGPYYQLFYTPQDEIKFNQALLKGVSAEYRSHPGVFARCTAKNVFFNFWFLGKRPQSTFLNLALQLPLLGLALAGVFILWKRGLLHQAAIVLLYIFYIPAVQSPIIAHARHSVLIVPFLAMLAAVSLVSAWRALVACTSYV
jgi:4-amino-4-deoxy-L-arabinose transferase-like glycosyltransferase